MKYLPFRNIAEERARGAGTPLCGCPGTAATAVKVMMLNFMLSTDSVTLKIVLMYPEILCQTLQREMRFGSCVCSSNPSLTLQSKPLENSALK